MLRNRWSFGLAMLLTIGIGLARADMVLVSGNSMDSSNTTFTTNLNKLPGHTYTFVAPGAFSGTTLSGFRTVWLDGFSQYTSLASLTLFLNAGGTVLIQSPGFGSEPLTAYPFTGQMTATFVGTGPNSVRIVTAAHPLNAGLTNANLSNWPPNSAFGFLGNIPAEYTLLTDDGNASELISIVRPVGSGLLVYTEQAISQSLSSSDLPVTSGQLTFLNNVLSVAVPEPSSFVLAGMTLVLGTLRLLGGRFRIFTLKP